MPVLCKYLVLAAINFYVMVRLITVVCIFFLLACNLDKKNETTQVPESNKSIMSDTTNHELVLHTKFHFFDTTVEVLFTDTKDTLSETQKKNLDQFVLKQDLLSPEIHKSIFEYYKSSYADYKSGWTMNNNISDKDLEKHLPTPTTPENLKPFIKPAIIHIQNKKDCKDGTIGIEFDCTWDIENGLGVLIENWKVVKTSVAEVSYF